MSAWRQLGLQLGAADSLEATTLLESSGAVSVTTTAAGDEELFVAHAGEAADGERVLWSRCRVVGLFPGSADLRDVRAQLSARFPALEMDESVLTEDDWAHSTNVHGLSMAFGGGRLRLEPRLSRAQSEPDAPTVYLDAGLAFGSGSHPTTRMCLEFLAGADLEGMRVLDFGCGSGILAIAAARLGAREVVAVDIDPQALLATKQNAHYNSVSERQLTVLTPAQFSPESKPFDFVVANILANPLIELAPALIGALAPGGVLTLTGVLRPQAAAVAGAYERLKLKEADALQVDGSTWVRLEGGYRAAT